MLTSRTCTREFQTIEYNVVVINVEAIPLSHNAIFKVKLDYVGNSMYSMDTHTVTVSTASQNNFICIFYQDV